LGRDQSHNDDPLCDAIVKNLRMLSVAGATVYRALSGRAPKATSTNRAFSTCCDPMPTMISAIDSGEKIASAAEAIEGMLEDGLIVISDADIVRLVRGQTVAEASDVKPAGSRIHISESDRHQGKPLYAAIVAKCRKLKIAGATVFRGIEGYGETAEIHRAHVVASDHPIFITIIDAAEKMGRLIPVVAEMIDTGLMATSAGADNSWAEYCCE
jgi:PII-like signaling protein